MAQTWRVTTVKKFAFQVLDALGSPLRPVLSPRPSTHLQIQRALVLEPWHIGDVVLATSLLQALRSCFPGIRITVLGKSHAEELLRHSDLADDVIIFDLPWTARSGKYDPTRYDSRAIRGLISRLRDGRFDLTVDARMDLRSNILAYMTKAPIRVGYAFGGGSFLLTHSVAAKPDHGHKVDDWLALMRPLWTMARNGLNAERASDAFQPTLRVTEDERDAARATLNSLGFSPSGPVIGVHAGASDPRRMWPLESYLTVAKRLELRHGGRTLLFLEPGAPDPPHGFNVATVRTDLRGMMALMTCCSLFLCNDSGPMHIADALEVPVVAVFLTGNPVWHRPHRAYQEIVGEGTGHDFKVAPTEDGVFAAAERQFTRRGLGGSVTDRSTEARR